ncbi:hypothetical protein EJB05_26503, partial [Eragrostis curvula]
MYYISQDSPLGGSGKDNAYVQVMCFRFHASCVCLCGAYAAAGTVITCRVMVGPEVTPSILEMSSSTSHAGDDSDKSVHTFTYSGDSSDYLSDSDNDLPPETEERHWRGIDRSTDERCSHGRPRRKEDGKQCSYVKWIDPEWPERVQVSFKKLWHQSNHFMRARS